FCCCSMKQMLNSFREYLKGQNLNKDQIEESISIVSRFRNFLLKSGKELETASYNDLYDFSDTLMADTTNTIENYISLYRFGIFQKNSELIIATLEIIDGREMIENFYNRLNEEFDQQVRDEIFEGIGIPPLGIRPESKPEITKKLVERFLTKFGEETAKTFFEIGLRNRYTQSYAAPSQLFSETNDIDEFLKQRHENLVATLQNHFEEETLFFIQEIDEEVISYVRARPTIEGGIREGNRVIITKIPYLAKQFIHATNDKMKRYYFCHNPWIRDALKEEDQPINPVFCGCSAGYFKNFWDAVLGLPVRVEVLKSVINGDAICEFALHLPPSLAKEG
ncbi:MAG: hypothetical protein ACFFE3_12785, partial [Candidatus Thorarchaeota archaeon]